MQTVDLVPAAMIKLNPNNPRVIKDAKFKRLVNSIREFPEMLEKRPVIVNKDLMILGGNMRFKACLEAGLKEIPIIIADWSEEKQREFIIKDNDPAGEWDWETLANEWNVEELAGWGLDVPRFVTEATDDAYEIPNEIQTDIVMGDLFEIGEHRLLCGDSTVAADVVRLLGPSKPSLMITDPPYGVNYDASWRVEAGVNKPWQNRAEGKVTNDDRSDWTETWKLSPADVCYIWHGGVHAQIVARSLEAAGFIIRSQIIWNKPSLVMGRGHYHWQHEPCWYAVRKGAKSRWIGDRKQSTIWDIQNMHISQGNVDDGKTKHSTQKPVECMARPARNHEGDVYEPFAGSGTTMVAAHQMKRRCLALEISPQYCQIIVDRMVKLDPGIEVKKNGEVWAKTVA